MKLKKFAVLALIFTTASGFTMEPVQAATAVASDVVSEGVSLEDGNSLSYTGVNTDNTVTSDTAAVENTDIINDDNNTGTPDDNIEYETVKGKETTKSKTKSTKKKNKYTQSELRLMSSIINSEAGNEPYQGKIAVGIVIMNRIKSKVFPNTLKGVIYQSGQFSPVRNGSLNKRFSEYDSGKTKSKEWKDCIKAAKKVLNGQRTILYKGKEKNMKSFHFFSMELKGARFTLGGHKFK